MAIYRNGRRRGFNEADWLAGTITLALLGTSYAPIAGQSETDLIWSQISAAELGGGIGYSRQNLGGKALTESSGPTGTTYYDGTEVNFGDIDAGQNVRWIVVMLWDAGTNGNSKILRVIDIRTLEQQNGNDAVTTGEAFRVLFASNHVASVGLAA